MASVPVAEGLSASAKQRVRVASSCTDSVGSIRRHCASVRFAGWSTNRVFGRFAQGVGKLNIGSTNELRHLLITLPRFGNSQVEVLTPSSGLCPLGGPLDIPHDGSRSVSETVLATVLATDHVTVLVTALMKKALMRLSADTGTSASP